MSERFAPYGKGNRGRSKVQAPKDQTPCKFYAQGSCDKGDDCVWMHVTPATNPTGGKGRVAGGKGKGSKGNKGGKGLGGKGQQICKYAAVGRCAKGANCEYSHTPEGQTNLADYLIAPGLAVNPMQNLQMPAAGGLPMAGMNVSGMGAMTPMVPMTPATNMMVGQNGKIPKDQVVCKYYASGQCDKGMTCEWSHPGYQGHDRAPVQVPVNLPPKGEVQCKYHQRGGCSKGGECEWSHI